MLKEPNMRTLTKLSSLVLLLMLATSSIAQRVKGIVLDENGVSLPGATVVAEGQPGGAFTDIDGSFNLPLPVGIHKLNVTFIGYKKTIRTVELVAGQTLELTIQLEPDAIYLDDVIVVGYGVQRRKEVTGSIASVSAKAITAMPTPSFEASLQGQVSGVQVTQGSGMAGAPSILRIRGIASVSAGGDPLYVVDGIPITQDYFLRGNSGAMNNNPLAALNPNDIESVEILKDAAATGIYGSRGANGVVLITTKRGTKKKGVAFEFTSRLGISTAASKPNMLNTDQYLTIRQEAWENDGGTGYAWLPNFTTANDDADTRAAAFKKAQGTDVDWVDQTIGIGVKQLYSLGVRKGGEKYAMFAGVSYDDNQSFLLGNSYERVSGRINFDYTFNSWAKVMASTSLSRGINNRVDAAWSGGLGDAMSNALPFYPVTQGDDYFLWQDEFGGTKNPVAYRESKVWKNTEDRSISNVMAILSPSKDFNVKLSGSFDFMHLREDIFEPPLNQATEIGTANRNANYVLNWNYSITGDYRYELSEESRFDFLIGTEFQRSDAYGYGIQYTDVNGPIFEVDSLLENARNFNKTINNPSQYSFLSYFGRVNYTLKDKYFFQGTARVDGSSRFGRNNRYGFFPSVSAGWVLSDEDFLKDSETVSFMKLRASWGKTGNASIPDYARFGTYSAANNGILYNQNPILFPLNPANPDLRWETSTTLDASLEIGIWQDRVTFEVGVYNKKSEDVLLNVNVPPSTGFTNYWDNVASVLNRGIEFSIKSRNLVGKFEWTTDFNIARNYNELLNIGDYTPDAVSGGTNDSRVIVGKPIGSFYLVEFSHVDPDNGLPVYLDLEGNETYDYDNAIRKYVGDGLPDVVGGLTNNFRFKNWDMSALVTFSLGAKIFDSSAKRQLGVVSGWNMREEILDRWRQPGDESTFPRMTLDETTYGLDAGFPWWNTSLFVYDASYLRMRNITVGYNFPEVKIRDKKFNQCRVAFNVSNLFTITNFPGLDPEVVRDFENAQDRNMSPNVTYLTPPQERSYNVSISLAF